MKIKLNGKVMHLPESWSDVPFKKRAKIFAILLAFDTTEAKTIAVRTLLDLPVALFFRMEKGDIAALVAQLPWFNLYPDPSPVQNYIEHKNTRYFLPKADFENGTAIEFLKLHELYTEFRVAKYPLSVPLLQKMAAVICRELDKNTKKRIVLTENENDALIERSEKFRHLEIVPATMVLKYIQGIFEQVEEVGTQFGIFGEPQTQKTGDKSPSVNLFGWKSVFRSIAETGPYKGGYDEVLQRPFWDIIEILAERAALQKSLEAKTDDSEAT